MKTNALYVVILVAFCTLAFEIKTAFDFLGAHIAAVLK